MRTRVFYEWDMEWLDPETIGTGDVEVADHDHEDRLADLLARYPDGADAGHRLVLVRDVAEVDASHTHDLVDRSWARVENGKLPEHFGYCGDNNEPGAKVPQRFHRELARQ